METERSNQVVNSYKQNKLNVSVMTRIRKLLNDFESEYAADRHWAWIGVIILIGLVMIATYFFISATRITIF